MEATINKVVFGSATVEVGDDLGAMENLGSASEIKFTEEYELKTLEIDNVGEISLGIKNHKATIAGSFYEIDLEKIQKARGGFDNYEPVAGSLVSDHAQTVSQGDWELDKFIPCENQNSNGSTLEVDSQGYIDVSGSSSGSMTHGTDFIMAKSGDTWGIIVLTGDANQNLTLTYDYTPSAGREFSSGGRVTINSKIIRLTHTTDSGKEFQIILYKAKNEKGMELSFVGDNSDEAMNVAFSFKGESDNTRSVGDQLYKIIDTRTY